MYDTSDPRSKLASPGAAPAAGQGYSPAQYVKFYDIDPQESDATVSTWYARGRNFIVALSETKPGAELSRTGQPDEYMILLEHPETGVTVTAGDESVDVPGYSVVIVPPGDSSVKVPDGGRIVRLFSTVSEDLAAKCANADSYTGPDPRVPEFEPWPEPVGGYRIRPYSLDVPPKEGRFGKIWRCTTFMVNFFDPHMGPRDTALLSPHHHDDFEQCSLALDGTYMHHIRWPWTKDMSEWREDDHELCGAPSVCVIPPPSIHTSRWLDDNRNQLVDIFAPPREDFSLQDGWVLNADEYPMPKNSQA